MELRTWNAGWFLVLFAASVIVHTDGLAVMSIDLGSEFMKVAIVKPGVPMEIVFNKESSRKTPVVVAFNDGERLFGNAALNVAVRFPKKAYSNLLDLLGKKYDNPQVENFRQKFPYYDLEEDPERGTVLFKHNDETKYSPEELLGMILETAKDMSSTFAEQPINEAVITVPPFFNQAERRAMIRAADLAGIKVLQLMNDNAAVALNYGIFRRKYFNGTALHYMFVDVGSTSSTATVVAYQEVKQKNAVTGIVDKFPQVTIKGVGFNRNLGSMNMQLKLRTHLANLFKAQGKTETDIFTKDRAMAKLLKEAGRVKHVLSANSDHYAQIENVMEDIDFRAKVTREELEEANIDLFKGVQVVVEDALTSSEVTLDEIEEVILMGGGTRVPKVQEYIRKAIKREELGKSVNTDEAAALGAVYQAAHLSKGFRVKKFNVKESTLFPIQVEFERVRATDDAAAGTTKLVTRTLFGRSNPYPQKKVMTFNKHIDDFGFSVVYGDLTSLSEEDKKIFGAMKLHQVSLSGVGAAHSKHSTDAEYKGVKAHFRMDDSGLLTLDKVESLFERAPTPEGEEVEEQSTLSKLGNTITNLFGGGEKDKESESKVEDPETPTEGNTDHEKSEEAEESADHTQTRQRDTKTEDNEETTQEEDSPPKVDDDFLEDVDEAADKNPTAEEPAEETDSKENKEEPKEEKQEEKNEGSEGADEKQDKTEEKKDDKKENAAKEEEKKEKKKPKPTIVKEDVKSVIEIVDLQEPTEETLKASRKVLKNLQKLDEERNNLLAARNDLESFIIETQDKLYRDEYEKCSTEEQRITLQSYFSTASDWLYEQDETTERKSYEDKLAELKGHTNSIFDRVKEFEERPKALEALHSIVNYSEHFLVGMKNYTGEDQPFTQVEYDMLEVLIQSTKDWNKTIMEEQLKTPLSEKPKVTLEDFARKMAELDREIKYLINKAKTFRPKPKEEAIKINETVIKTGDEAKDTPDEETKDEFESKSTSEEQTNDDKDKDTNEEKKEDKEEEPIPLEIDDNTDSTTTTTTTEDTTKKHGHGHDPDDEL